MADYKEPEQRLIKMIVEHFTADEIEAMRDYGNHWNYFNGALDLVREEQAKMIPRNAEDIRGIPRTGVDDGE